MSWFRKSPRRQRATARTRRPVKRNRAGQRRRVVKTVSGLAVLLLIAGVVWGARRLEAYVLSRPEYQVQPELVLIDVPEGLNERMMAVVEPFTTGPWTNPKLCRQIAEALRASAWVEHVRFVRRYADARVVISCDYRTPKALFQVGGDFLLIASDGVRLPGRYGYHPSLIVVQGVAGLPVEPGEQWQGDDAGAGLAIIDLLHGEPFFDQITGVLVGNYGGRRDKREAHIVLATAPAGGRVAWGSAIGEEIEENTAEQKVEILRENHRRWGRIDAGRDYIDISTFPDRFTTRASGPDGRRW